MTPAHLLEVQDLHTVFPTKHGTVKAVDGVSFHLDRGETLGIVGESGSGKSVTVQSVMRLLQRPGRIAGGRVLFKGRDLARASSAEMQEIRGEEIAMIFQDPMTSMNLKKVGIPEPEKRAEQYPHEFSGGMRQRAMIAMGLSTSPSVLIADEPTTALDVTIQAQILDLLRQVNQEFGTATILITHNLGVVAGMCERVLVMYGGKVVESGPTEDVFAKPRHPYTWSLLRSIPLLDAEGHEPLRAIEGMPPDLINLPTGCAFHPRCAFRINRCTRETPPLEPVGPTQMAACWVTQAGKDLDEAVG